MHMLRRWALAAGMLVAAPAIADTDGAVGTDYGSVFGRTVVSSFPGVVGGTAYLLALAVGGSDRTWMFGNADNQSPNNRLLVARLRTTTGLLDTGFGAGSGLLAVTLPAGVTSYLVRGAVVQADGKPIVVGTWTQNGDTRAFACRLNVAGNLDATYASGGCRVLRAFLYTNERCGSSDIAYDPADASVVLLGYCSNIDQPAQRPFLARITNTGNLDTEFGAGAGITTPTHDFGELRYLSALAIQPSGRFVAVGSLLRAQGNYDITVVQFSNDGTPDPSFGSNGTFTFNPNLAGGLDDMGGDIAVRPDGTLLVLGLSESANSGASLVLEQLTSTGTNDPSYGSNGQIISPEALDNVFFLAGPSALFTSQPVLALDDLGRAIVAGRNGLAVNENPTNVRVYRFTARGAVDRQFGDAGRGAVDITNEVALPGTGAISEAPIAMSVQRDRVLLGIAPIQDGIRYMLTLTLKNESLFADRFE